MWFVLRVPLSLWPLLISTAYQVSPIARQDCVQCRPIVSNSLINNRNFLENAFLKRFSRPTRLREPLIGVSAPRSKNREPRGPRSPPLFPWIAASLCLNGNRGTCKENTWLTHTITTYKLGDKRGRWWLADDVCAGRRQGACPLLDLVQDCLLRGLTTHRISPCRWLLPQQPGPFVLAGPATRPGPPGAGPAFFGMPWS